MRRGLISSLRTGLTAIFYYATHQRHKISSNVALSVSVSFLCKRRMRTRHLHCSCTHTLLIVCTSMSMQAYVTCHAMPCHTRRCVRTKMREVLKRWSSTYTYINLRARTLTDGVFTFFYWKTCSSFLFYDSNFSWKTYWN